MKEKRFMAKTEIHMDDFAISLNASRESIRLIEQGKVNGISMIPNFDCFSICVSELIPVLKKKGYEAVRISIHLNFMEGKPCAPTVEVPDLVDENGFFKLSWIDLLIASYSPMRYSKLKQQLKTEIKFQIQKIVKILPEGYKVRIDSHQHTHVLPIVFSALKEAIKDGKIDIEYIRLPREPWLPYLKHPVLFRTYSAVNITKNIILNFYTIFMKGWIKKSGYHYAYLWGVIMSGQMDQKRVEVLFEDFHQYASSRNQELEILFHAGSVLATEISQEYSKPGFIKFHLSSDRMKEKETIDNFIGSISEDL